jgi:DNA repair photolyase
MAIFVTITTDNDQILRQFEPHTSLYEERIAVIRYLVEHGFNTNVMMEPYLSDPIPVINHVLTLIGNGIIAVGGMNYTPQVKFTDDSSKRAVQKFIFHRKSEK